MSKITLDIVATVRNQASAALKKITDSVKTTNKAVQKSTKGMSDFNKTASKSASPLKQVERAVIQTGLAVKKSTDDIFAFNRATFHASLFVNNYLRSIKSLSSHIEEGAKLDRLEQEFTRVLGPSGQLLQQIRGFTDVSIDQMEAMRAGIALKTLGISTNIKQVAEMVAMAGVAAKQSGQDSATGIKQFTEFLKTGNLELLQSLNLIRTADPALKTQLQLLAKYGGVLSSALTSQEKLAIGMTALRRATQGSMKGNKDLLDTVLDLKQYWSMLTAEVGIVIGKAIQPLLEKFIDLMISAKAILTNLRTLDQGFLFLIKSVIVSTTAITGLVAVLGALKLTVKGLGAIGFGLPKLWSLLSLLSFGFFTLTANVNKSGEALKSGPFGKSLEKLRVLGAILRGVFEAVSSAFDPENQAKGIGQISGSVAKLLEQYGLITTEIIDGKKVITGGLVQNLSKGFFVIAKFVDDVKKTIMGWFSWLTGKIDNIGKMFNKAFSFKTKLIPRSWLDDLDGFRGVLLKVAAAFAILKFIPGGKGLLSKLPGVGRLFGGGGKSGAGPKGTANDPIYTKDTAALLGGAATTAGNLAGKSSIFGSISKVITGSLGNSIKAIKTEHRAAVVARTLSGAATGTAGAAEGAATAASIFTSLTSIRNILKAGAVDFVQFAVFSEAISGFIRGFDVNSIFKFFDGLKYLATSINFDNIGSSFGLVIDKVSKFGESLSSVIEWITSLPIIGTVLKGIIAPFKSIGKGYEVIGGVVSNALSSVGESAKSQGLENRINQGIAGKQVQIASSDIGETPGMAATNLISQLETMKQSQRASITKQALGAALGLNSEGGMDVTEGEFQKILQAAFTSAMNKADFTKHTEKTAKNTIKDIPKPSTQNRGGC